MRLLIAADMFLTSSAAMAADVADEAHKLAVSGRDDYWNCLAREYPRDSNKGLSEPEFTSLIASACPSERQSFRVSLIAFLTQQFPDQEADKHLATANRAIAFAQKDIVTAFVRRKAPAK